MTDQADKWWSPTRWARATVGVWKYANPMYWIAKGLLPEKYEPFKDWADATAYTEDTDSD